MAGLPKADTAKDATKEAAVAEKAAPELVFEYAEAMPDAAEINAAVNPFQDAVNELIRNGGATSVLLDSEDVKWARDNVRRAANNAGMGGKTREVPEKDGSGKVRVWFTVGPKVNRPRKNK